MIDRNPPSVLILGATSDIGRAIAAAFAVAGHPLRLAARNSARLEATCQDLRLRYGGEVTRHEFDVLAVETHAAFLEGLPDLPGVTVCVVGVLGNQRQDEQAPEAARWVMRSTYEGPASVLAEVANRYAVLGQGSIIGISSVAGDRGRASNYIYGSAKAGLSAYLSGLRGRMAKVGVQVMTVKPGFVETRMTAGLPLPPALTAQPEEVGVAVYRGWKHRKDMIYVRPVWRWIMMVIRLLPEWLFKRLSI